MTPGEGSKRFLQTTQGWIVTLLRRAARTVNELAAALDLTDNAIRAHLATLERDGLVEQCGLRPGSRKPNALYSLAPAAERLFPKAYGALLQQILVIVTARSTPAEMDELFSTVGRRLAVAFRNAVQGEDVRTRVEQALAVLGELGGLAEIEEEGGRLVLRGFDCPLAAAVSAHPAACLVAEALLTDLVGLPVRQRCVPTEPPRCQFEVGRDESAGEGAAG